MHVSKLRLIQLLSLLSMASIPLFMGQSGCPSEDMDGDGWSTADGDCNDNDPAVHPGAEEVCDGADNDCNGISDDGVLGVDPACPGSSCMEVLDSNPGTSDGTYWLDPAMDGSASEFVCDMTTDGGGWTRIFADDFESSVDAGWSMQATYTCSSYGTVLGGYGNIAGGEMSNTVSTQNVKHAEARADFEYLKLDSWDGELAYMNLDDITIWSANLYYYEGSELCGWDRGYEGSYDNFYPSNGAIEHMGPSLTIVAGSTLDQDSSDESFGLNYVTAWVR